MSVGAEVDVELRFLPTVKTLPSFSGGFTPELLLETGSRIAVHVVRGPVNPAISAPVLLRAQIVKGELPAIGTRFRAFVDDRLIGSGRIAAAVTGTTASRAAIVGIDVAISKKKRLPICVLVDDGGVLTPLPLKKLKALPPRGFGNAFV